MNNVEFVKKLRNIADNYKTLYIMGCFGAPMTPENKKYYCSNYAYNEQPARTRLIKSASEDTFGFDCVCLIKGALWGWNGDKTKKYGGAVYASNGVPDINATNMIARCLNVSTDFSTIEVGEAVWMPGHIGVYIGNGQCVESTPKWTNNVQYSYLGNVSEFKKGNNRVWTKHGKLPYIEYIPVDDVLSPYKPNQDKPNQASSNSDLAIGDEVYFSGTTHYVASNYKEGKPCKPGLAKIMDKYNGKHPYLVKGIKPATVYGWVDKEFITKKTGKTTDNLNLREGSNTSTKSIGIMKKGTKVFIISTESNGWYKVYSVQLGKVGYCSNNYVSL